MSAISSIRVPVLALLLVGATNARAQSPAASQSRWQFRAPSGRLIGTGTQRDQVKDANSSAAQLSWMVRPRVAITATFAWARSRDVATVGAPKLDVFTTDVGVEGHTGEWFADAPVSISGFAGLGGGARSYNYRSLDEAATHNLAGYASIGGTAEGGRVGLRLEARNYATGFKPLTGAGSEGTRNDVVVMAAFTLRLRAAR